MFNINKKDRDLLKETGSWSIWDTLFGQYADTLVVILGLVFLASLIWAEVEYDIISYYLHSN